MGGVDILVPEGDVRRWHVALAERLAASGHDVSLVGVDVPSLPPTLDHVFRLERLLLGDGGASLVARARDVTLSASRTDAMLRIDLTGDEHPIASPVLRPRLAGSCSAAEAARLLMAGGLPDVEILLDGRTCMTAAPMVDSRVSIARGLDDVLARVITLLVDCVARYPEARCDAAQGIARAAPVVAQPGGSALATAYLFSAVPRQLVAICRRLMFRSHHWRVGYRFRGALTVAETGLMAGAPWHILPDDGKRFYADPFPFSWQGRNFVFVEELAHDTDKGVISVAELFHDGSASTPRTVLEEPFHLSYPQVFARDGGIWMIPEGGAGAELVLYRAESFPDRWVRHSVLVPGRRLFDPSLLEHGGRLWLFATECDGHGSASDTLVVYSAPTLFGPWEPHPQNPIRIDRAAARPGGAFQRVRDRIVLPIQDGTDCYGGGLGLCDLLALDETTVRLTRPAPVLPSADWPYPRVHTSNANAEIEVIDGIAPSRRRFLRGAA